MKRFWQWFYENHQIFGEHLKNSDLLAHLNDRIRELSSFSWEVGPGNSENHVFTISPNGDPKLLIETKETVAHAIKCQDWEFNYAKPKKERDLIFEFYGQK